MSDLPDNLQRINDRMSDKNQEQTMKERERRKAERGDSVLPNSNMVDEIFYPLEGS